MSRRAKEQRRRRVQAHQQQAKRRRQRLEEVAQLAAATTAEDCEGMIGQVVEAPLTAEEEAGPASIGIVRGVWRNSPVEDAHAGSGLNRISDGEMFAANVALTRLSLERYRPTGGTDWQALFNPVTDPDRVLIHA